MAADNRSSGGSYEDVSFQDASESLDDTGGASRERRRTLSTGADSTSSRTTSLSLAPGSSGPGGVIRSLVRQRSKRDDTQYKAMRKTYDAEKAKKRGELRYPDMDEPPMYTGYIFVRLL